MTRQPAGSLAASVEAVAKAGPRSRWYGRIVSDALTRPIRTRAPQERAQRGPSASVARLSLLQEVIDGQSGEKDQRKEGHDEELLLARKPPEKEGVEGQKPDQE